MPVKSSGTLSFATDIVGEFEDTTPHKLSEFYRGGDKVPDAGINANVPTSSEIKFSDFYGATNVIEISIASNSYTYTDPATGNPVTVNLNMGTTLNLFTEASKVTSPVNGKFEVPFVFTIDYNSIFNNSIITGGEFGDLTIDNTGIICGRGGHGLTDGTNFTSASKSNIGSGTFSTGNPAIYIDSNIDILNIVNNTYGFIAGGGNSTTNAAAQFYSFNQTRRSRKFGGVDIEWVAYQSRMENGNGGGWNGGVGGGRRVSAYTQYADDYTIQYYGPFDNDPYQTPGSYQRVVTGRSVNGTTGYSGQASKICVSTAGPRSVSGPSNPPSATGGSGGSGLNGGSAGTGGGITASYASSQDWEGVRTKARAASGGGGGNGIGNAQAAGDPPTNVGSSGRGTAAGAAYSVQVAGGVTFTTSSFVNGGKRYGDSSITVSAP